MSMITDWLAHEIASFPLVLGILVIVALIVSSIGFYRTVLFISIGYAFSITAMAIITPVLLSSNLTWVSLLQNLFLLIWSVRLGVYLVRREFMPSFGPQRERNRESSASASRPIQFLIWISVSLLYTAMFSPSVFRLVNSTAGNTLFGTTSQLIGLIVMLAGLVIEGMADQQKADFKAKNPKSFCNVGLYRWVRCPNYLGEILFWVGNWIVALAFYASLTQWVFSLIGLMCIVLIMMGSTKRLEQSQGERYGSLPNYQTYIQTTPVLFPFVPVYTLKNIRVYLE